MTGFKTIGDEVRELRKRREREGSLRDIDKITGVPAPRVSEIENGHAYLGTYAAALAKALGPQVFALAIREAELRGQRLTTSLIARLHA